MEQAEQSLPSTGSPSELLDLDEEFVKACAGSNPELIAFYEAEIDRRDRALNWTPPSLASCALGYALRGWPVFPLQPMTKIPYPGSRGFKDASTDEGAVREWWRVAPDSNIGCATGHLFDVIDVDGPAGVRSTLGAWEHFSALDVLATSCTPRPGGRHILVPATGRGNAGRLLPDVDYRGLGGYVVLPPSVLDAREGQREGAYRWLRAPDERLFPDPGQPSLDGQGDRDE